MSPNWWPWELEPDQYGAIYHYVVSVDECNISVLLPTSKDAPTKTAYWMDSEGAKDEKSEQLEMIFGA